MSRSTSRAFSTAAPIWLATAVTSLRSLSVKRSPPSRSVRLMTPTQRSGDSRRAIADRHAEERLAPVSSRGVGSRRVGAWIGGIVRDHPPLAIHPRRDRALVVHADRLQPVEPEAPRRHGPQHAGRLVEHHDRRAPGADHGAHLARDRLGGLLEPHRLSQDLADRVEEVDLLVPAAQLLGEEDHAAARHRAACPPAGSTIAAPRARALRLAGHLEPESFDLTDRLEPDGRRRASA